MYLPYLYNKEYFHYPKYLVCFTCLSQSPPYPQLATTDLFTVSVVLYFSRMSYTCVCMCQLLSCIQLFAILWTVAHHTPLSIGFSRQKSWNGLPILFPGDFPNLGIEPRSPALQADSLLSEVPGSPVTYLESYSTHYFLSLSKMHLIFSHVISCLDSSFLLNMKNIPLCDCNTVYPFPY